MNETPIRNALFILNISKVDSVEDIKSAYRASAKANHPDKFKLQSDKFFANERMKAINEANILLKSISLDEIKRVLADTQRKKSNFSDKSEDSIIHESTTRTKRDDNNHFWGRVLDRFIGSETNTLWDNVRIAIVYSFLFLVGVLVVAPIAILYNVYIKLSEDCKNESHPMAKFIIAFVGVALIAVISMQSFVLFRGLQRTIESNILVQIFIVVNILSLLTFTLVELYFLSRNAFSNKNVAILGQ